MLPAVVTLSTRDHEMVPAFSSSSLPFDLLEIPQRPAPIKIRLRGFVEAEVRDQLRPGTVGIQLLSNSFGAFGPH